jgi:hypothetical protein
VSGVVHWQGAYSGDEKEGSNDKKTHDVCFGGPAWPESELDGVFKATAVMYLVACCDGTCWNAWNVRLYCFATTYAG